MQTKKKIFKMVNNQGGGGAGHIYTKRLLQLNYLSQQSFLLSLIKPSRFFNPRLEIGYFKSHHYRYSWCGTRDIKMEKRPGFYETFCFLHYSWSGRWCVLPTLLLL